MMMSCYKYKSGNLKIDNKESGTFCSADVDDLFVREDLLDRYHVDEKKVKEFPDVYSFNPPAMDKEINKAEL